MLTIKYGDTRTYNPVSSAGLGHRATPTSFDLSLQSLRRAVFPTAIQGPNDLGPITSGDHAGLFGNSDQVGYLLSKPGVVHNHHFGDGFSVMVKRTVCLRNAYLPAAFQDPSGQRCWTFKQSRCFQCSDPAYNFGRPDGIKRTVHQWAAPYTESAGDEDFKKILHC